MTTVRTTRWLKTTTALTSAFGLAMALAPHASANPTGGQVAAGEATISAPDTSTLQIDQTSRNAVIEWRSFNIDAGETTRFVQPDNQSWTLNRVTGETAPSHILGTLEANGNVAIVNPDGILFGGDARVDVGGLIATTHDIENDDFMAGRFQFNRPGDPSASVVNEGSISIADYGLGAFVAPGVRNSGVITARLGSVSLASGNAFSLDLYGDNLVHLLVDDEIVAEVVDVATGLPVADLVKNEGRISADGGTVALTAATARRAVNSVVNNSGIIEANTVGRRGGKIVLGAQTAATKKSGAPTQRVKVSGQLLAMNVPIPTPRPDPAAGGHIAILGEHIEVSNATIDASGEGGGGTVLIGGDYMGGHGEPTTIEAYGIDLEADAVATARSVAIDKDTVILADALERGDGGKVVVWADRDTTMDGAIQARGGAIGGDGGFVEVSGRERLAFSGSVDIDAPDGQVGTLLLDPANATVGTIGTWIITPASITSALASGNVIVTTGNQGEGDGDLTVAQAINWSTANSLTLRAHRDIKVNASITNSGGADVSLRADGSGTGIGTVAFAPGTQVSTAGAVSLFYNPSVNPAGSGVNTTSYLNPTEDFSAHLNGGENSVYMLVNSVYDLQNIENNLSANYATGRDIDASVTAGWIGSGSIDWGFIPLGRRGLPQNSAGNNSRIFSGDLDGLGHTIYGLTSTGDAGNVGLFGSLGGSVRNLNIENSDFRSDATLQIGTIAAEVRSTGVIENVHVVGQVGSDGVSGGLVGHNRGLITQSSFSGTVIGDNGSGGIAGWNLGTGTIQDSISSGQVGSLTNGDWYDIFDEPNGGYGPSGHDNGGITGYNRGMVVGTYSSSAVYGAQSVGGLVGDNNVGGTIRLSSASGAVNGGVFVGGLVGSNISLVDDSHATGNVLGETYVGGLAGYHNGLVNPTSGDSFIGQISGSFATGNARATTIYGSAGGLVGVNEGGEIENSYATGNVDGHTNVGGLIGLNRGSDGSPQPGTDLVPGPANVSKTYAVGEVTGTTNVGGLIGQNDGGIVASSFFDVATSGQAAACGINSGACGAVGLTTGELKSLPTFTAAGWDFTNIWALDASVNGGYPYLRAHATIPINPAPGVPITLSPDPNLLTVDPFPATISAATSPFQPTITVTGTGFSSVTEIRWSWTDPNGITGTATWNAGNNWGNGRAQFVSDTSAVLTPVLVAAGDPQGTYQWDVTVVAGGQEVTRSFTVNFQQVTQPPEPIPPHLDVNIPPQNLLTPSTGVGDWTQAGLLTNLPSNLSSQMSGMGTWFSVSNLTAGEFLQELSPFISAAMAVYGDDAFPEAIPVATWRDFVGPDDLGLTRWQTLNIAFSGFNAVLYRVDGKLVLAFEGTNLAEGLSDLLSDFRIGAWGITNQYEFGQYIAAAVRLRYPNVELILTGHSMGGGIAAYAGGTLGIPTIAIDPSGNRAEDLAHSNMVLNVIAEGGGASYVQGRSHAERLVGKTVIISKGVFGGSSSFTIPWRHWHSIDRFGDFDIANVVFDNAEGPISRVIINGG